MSEKLSSESIARFQVRIEQVEGYLDRLQGLELSQEQMQDLLTSFRHTCEGFKSCLEDLDKYVKRNG